ncbi:MAG: hypothetical protein HC890_02870 [Chloroflexaceae bacterium]|nr:hypothetical protein [Chloroflexaceae bacterium]
MTVTNPQWEKGDFGAILLARYFRVNHPRMAAEVIEQYAVCDCRCCTILRAEV